MSTQTHVRFVAALPALDRGEAFADDSDVVGH
jgi:hypothetical protein